MKRFMLYKCLVVSFCINTSFIHNVVIPRVDGLYPSNHILLRSAIKMHG
jgi:hypothetical protein